MEILISVIGLVVYWYLSSLNKKDKKKTPPNQTINNENIVPHQNFNYEEDHYSSNQSVNNAEPSSFGELLGMLSDNEAFTEHKKANNPFDKERTERQLESDLQEYSPSMISGRTYENDTYNWNDDFAKKEKKVSILNRTTKKRNSNKKANKTASLFKSPSRIKDAFIMNEVLQRKYE
ncbi:hypothetical protein [Flammeovirga pacifica]|uniref:Uncharacterized protein n=1 Tax=Flammeovirga pacifica TaxID=915059 RepID=A0A1S1YX59_FLAPC|nr:hypothetical protein [Flammeovirga pacifica]OHX65609.1 hypothetical protein NH26_04220 [Flammeovirga pacifica]